MATPERTTFFDEQARRRRAAQRWSLLWAAGVVLIGAPLAALLTPLVYLAAALVVRAADLVLPVPEAVYGLFHQVVRWVSGVLALADVEHVSLPVVAERLPGVVAVLVPGLVAGLGVWLSLRALFLRAGAGGVIEALGGREPRPDDPEERQLVHLVEEMAIAAGCPVPRVRLLDRPDPNAAVVGATPADAVLVVQRGALDRLDRGQTQALIGHRMAAVAAGDLALTTSALAVYQTIGLLLTACDALLSWSPSAWRDLARVVRWAVPGGREEPAYAVAALLDSSPMELRKDGLFPVDDDGEPTRWQRALERWPWLHLVLVPFIPFYLLLFFIRAEIHFLRALLVDPLVMLVLRARCYLADAGAVRLTRYPDAVAAALSRLRGEVEPPPGGGRLDSLFVIGPESEPGTPRTKRGDWGGIVAPHPSVAKRLKRLEAMGAAVAGGVDPAAAARRSADRRSGPIAWLAMLVVIPMLLVAGYLLLMLVAFFFLAAAGLAVLVALGGMMLVERLLL